MTQKVGRNDPCPCGSGKKYKQCCLKQNKPKRGLSGRMSVNAGGVAMPSLGATSKRKFKATVLNNAKPAPEAVQPTESEQPVEDFGPDLIARTHADATAQDEKFAAPTESSDEKS